MFCHRMTDQQEIYILTTLIYQIIDKTINNLYLPVSHQKISPMLLYQPVLLESVSKRTFQQIKILGERKDCWSLFYITLSLIK